MLVGASVDTGVSVLPLNDTPTEGSGEAVKLGPTTDLETSCTSEDYVDESCLPDGLMPSDLDSKDAAVESTECIAMAKVHYALVDSKEVGPCEPSNHGYMSGYVTEKSEYPCRRYGNVAVAGRAHVVESLYSSGHTD